MLFGYTKKERCCRFFIFCNDQIKTILPKKSILALDRSFEQIPLKNNQNRGSMPEFDKLRASINLVVAAVLISLATSLKLPLSTTYVTFMVAMGTSLADRAWSSDSAVYRVAGVLNVIGGWFFTAFIAFTGCGLIAFLINLGGPSAIAILLFLALIILARNYIAHRKEMLKLKMRML